MNAACETFHYTPCSHEHCFCASSINFMCQKPLSSHKTWSLEHFFYSYCCTKEANSGRYSSAQCCISFYLRYQSHKVTHNKLKSIECIWKFISCAAAKPERKKGFHGFVKRSAEKLWCGLHLKKKICTNHAKTSYFINCVYLRVPARQTCNKRRKLSLRSRSIL